MKIVIITGAASGIGAACAAGFHAKNYQVIGVDCQQPVEKPAIDVFFQYCIVDLSKMAEINAFVEEISKMVDHIDVLVNCAGLTIIKPFQEQTEHNFDYVMAVNLKAPFFLTQKLLPLMTEGDYSNRSVVNISSIHATATSRNVTPYAASKGGISALTRTLLNPMKFDETTAIDTCPLSLCYPALELANLKIRVNAVQPGLISTPSVQEMFKKRCSSKGMSFDEIIAKDVESIPAGRHGIGKDIANAVLFLTDEENSFITGESLVVDGGVLAGTRLSAK